MADTKLIQEFHSSFSAHAHNTAVDILYEDDPTADQISSLIELAHVAHWHWSRRDDKAPQNISVAQWLLSRAYSANGLGDKALVFARQSLATIEHEDLLPSFYGYSHEALARAYLLLQQKDEAAQHLNEAREIAERVPSAQAKEWLLDQINRINI